MAKIWPVYEGKKPTLGEAWARLPVSEAVAIFELQPSDLVSDFVATPRFGDVERDLTYAGYKYIVVEVEPGEGRQAKWNPGFYRSRIKPKEAFSKLIRQALVGELGNNNVVRVEFVTTTDSRGRDALKVTVVISPGATERLKNGATLDALVSLRARLHEMREERIPVIEYATEEELAQDAGSQS
jgi:proline racemase